MNPEIRKLKLKVGNIGAILMTLTSMILGACQNNRAIESTSTPDLQYSEIDFDSAQGRIVGSDYGRWFINSNGSLSLSTQGRELIYPNALEVLESIEVGEEILLDTSPVEPPPNPEAGLDQRPDNLLDNERLSELGIEIYTSDPSIDFHFTEHFLGTDLAESLQGEETDIILLDSTSIHLQALEDAGVPEDTLETLGQFFDDIDPQEYKSRLMNYIENSRFDETEKRIRTSIIESMSDAEVMQFLQNTNGYVLTQDHPRNQTGRNFVVMAIGQSPHTVRYYNTLVKTNTEDFPNNFIIRQQSIPMEDLMPAVKINQGSFSTTYPNPDNYGLQESDGSPLFGLVEPGDRDTRLMIVHEMLGHLPRPYYDDDENTADRIALGYLEKAQTNGGYYFCIRRRDKFYPN